MPSKLSQFVIQTICEQTIYILGGESTWASIHIPECKTLGNKMIDGKKKPKKSYVLNNSGQYFGSLMFPLWLSLFIFFLINIFVHILVC